MAAAATSSSSSPLESLPDDLLIDVLDHLDRARDISHLEQASRRTRAVVAQDGWRRFVRTRFGAAGGAHHYHPSSSYSSSPAAEWRSAADRLTYLDRCWDRRAVVLINFGEKKQGQQRQRREPRNGAAPQATQQSVGFHPALDAGLLPGGGGGELAAWGVGENLVTRVSAHGRPDEWRRLDGREEGYASGFGDVTAVSTLAYGGGQEPAVAVGRANGELRIVRASGPRFGETLRTVARKSDDTPSAGGTGTPTRKSPAQVAVSWTDWHAPSSFLASSCNTTISLHDLSRPADDDGGSEEEESLRPVLVYDAALEDDPNDVSLIRNVRFASRDTLAVSLGGTRHPLRWGRITPAGLVLDPVPRSGAEAADFLATRAEPDRGGRTTVRAVEPVPLSSSSSVSSSCPLLLSAWDDGSYRLTDPRTPSPHDASYRDRWQPYEPGGSLLVYGARHFVAGSNISPDLRFFDFRFPRSYHHADALPCSASPPVPRPPFVSRPGKGNDDDDDDDDDDEEEDEDERGTRATNNLKKNRRGGNPPACDHASGRRCAWHDLSRRPRWRPDATLHTGRSWRNRVHALAKAADASSRFYVGFEGAVTEVNLCLSRDVGGGDNSLLERTHPEGWEAVPSKGRVGLIENGVGLVDEREWNRAPTENLEIWHQNQEAILRGTTTTAPTDTNGSGANGSGGGGGGEGKGHSRLDEAYVPPPPRREGEVRRSQRGWRS